MHNTDLKISDYRHKLPVEIRFNDIDMFGHINNTIYLQFFDQGKYAYFRQFMDGPFGSTPTAPVVANINVDFHAPSHIDDRLTVCTAITAIYDSSMIMDQIIVDEKGNIKCSARTVMVNIDMHKGIPTTVDDTWRNNINTYEGHKVSHEKE